VWGAQSGDLDAFGELVERHRRAVFRAALAALGSPAEADDVTQEAFVTAYRKIGGFRGDAAFRTWLLAIAWRKALDRREGLGRWMQRLASRPSSGADTEADPIEQVADGRRTQEAALLAAELQREVKALITTLPRKLRDALLLAGSGEYSYEEIAAALKIPLGTLKWRVSEARKVLKQKLAARGFTDVG
jgi:RNA polymerase sigma-70 factor (ECF subfamily)